MNTIAAIATAQGIGGIGVIRVSGDDAINLCDKIFKSIKKEKECLLKSKGYTAHYGEIFLNGEFIDDVVVTVFKKPHSYTGEDVVEISCHGGLYITKKVMDVVISNGASIAAPGEFTKRAFLNGKIGLTEAESVMDIISANGQAAIKAAQSTRMGFLYRKIQLVKDNLIELAAQLSVWSDYPDEEFAYIDKKTIKSSLLECKDILKKLLSTYRVGRIFKEGIYTIIVGRPNVGKSTLMNLLSGYDKSIVTDIPGTTRDVVEESISIGDICLKIADTAGIRETNDTIERIGIERSKQQIKTADLILVLFDASESIAKEDMDIIQLIEEGQVIAIVNKVDLKQKLDLTYLHQKFNRVIEISALNEKGIEEVIASINDFVGMSKIDPYEGMLSNERQKFAVEESLKNILEAVKAIDKGITFDAITVLIEDSIDNLLELTGERVSEQIVNKVFSSFCVGK